MLFSSSLEAQQISVFFQTLVDRMQEELDHPSPENELDSSATLEDYCHNFFLKKEFSERLKEQNQLLHKLILQRKIYIFNLKKKNSLTNAACHKIDSGCHKIGEKLSTIIPQVQDLEVQQQEFKQTVAETRLLQDEIREIINQSQAAIEEIRVYTSIPTQEELDGGKKQNPILASLQTQCEILRSYIESMNTINEKKSADLKTFNQAFQELQVSYKKLDKELENFRQVTKRFQQDNRQLVKGVEELREDNEQLAQGLEELQEVGKQFEKGVEELREDNKQLAQGVEELREDNKQFAQGVEELREDNKQLAKAMEKLRVDGKQFAQGVKEFGENVNKLTQNNKQFQHKITNQFQERKKAREIMEEIKGKEREIEELLNLSPMQNAMTPTSSTCTELVSQQITKRKIILLGPINSLMARLPSHKNFSISFLNKICLIFAWIGIFQVANTILSFYRPKKNHLSDQKGAFFSAISSSKRKQTDE
ncbi:hypothetical protein [Candidatus Protochlamydia amoebophila]|uniref:Uncharacterized protein n=1 Tax=Protochlamydia amoebophila (strain UWE25) TaxID=264201 RepID=A0A2P9HAG3_PARUW|nr:hypothetical protein [Candidatus Protochlamydia amoebophila]SPJ31998.1 unnamed protein product [Candidatus Protochlamydia amoebophila UWE25]